MDKILDPLGHLDEDSELCVFDDYGREYCTENSWNDQGIIQADVITRRASFLNPEAALISFLFVGFAE